ncbi:Wzz/FepE/Etk N-terminal domain-containing protein [Pseudomonas sp. Marseille-Q1929]|uniref:Wzz/FepE/Etk N-terminal domain-containing protein n=1 Tax=Pseudomonas sp. Marseille-Q1929 TaxID=2730402 RepID=UPI003242F9E8
MPPTIAHPASDEIDLFELAHGIWKQRVLVVACAAIAAILGVGYVLLAPQVYQASSVLRAVELNELDALNRSEVYPLTPADALSKVALQLNSYDTRLGFFKANATLFETYQRPGQSQERSFDVFDRSLVSQVLPDPKNSTAPGTYIRLEMQYPQGSGGVALLNGFVDYAIARQRDLVAADVEVIVNNRLAELGGKIDAVRENYENEKATKIARLLEGDAIKRGQLQDELGALREEMGKERSHRLARLAEAIAIARSVGITRPTTPSAMGAAALRGASQVTEISRQTVPLFFMGTQVLEAERAVLQQRSSDDVTDERVAQITRKLRLLEVNREVDALKARSSEDMFLQDVEWLRTEAARLRALNLDLDGLKLAAIDRPAQEPLAPIKPRKAFVVALSLAAGLMLGVLVAVVRHFASLRRGHPRGRYAPQ